VRVVPFGVHVPVVLWLDFRLVRPRTLVKRRTRHTTRPDLDKLERAVKDAMKGIVYVDDGQVDEVHKRKRFAREGEMEGVVVLAMSPEEAVGVQTTRWPVDPSGVAGPRSTVSIGTVQTVNSAIAGDQETPGKG